MTASIDEVMHEKVWNEEEWRVDDIDNMFGTHNGLPTGWCRMTSQMNGGTVNGFISHNAAVTKREGRWFICPVDNGSRILLGRMILDASFDNHVAAIVAAEMMWPRTQDKVR